MFGNLAEMAGLMKKAKDLQGNLKNIKAELAEAEFTGEAGSGRVKVIVSGDMRIKKLTVNPDCTRDVTTLENLIATAINNALDSARLHTQEKMTEITGGLNIPGLF